MGALYVVEFRYSPRQNWRATSFCEGNRKSLERAVLDLNLFAAVGTQYRVARYVRRETK